jgi:uncharacterized protein YidB (DUF937 family)
MSRGYPSMTALLALLAMAGYQNRDKIAEWLNAAQRNAGTPAQAPQGSAGSALPGNLGGMLGGTSIGDLLSGGLRDLVNTFKQAGHGDVADSWVGRGANKQVAPSQLEQAIGSDVEKSSFRGSRKIFRTLSTSIRQTGVFPRQRTFRGLSDDKFPQNRSQSRALLSLLKN